MSTMHDLHKQEIKMPFKKGKKILISIGVQKLNYAKWELCKNLFYSVTKRMLIGPLTALPDQQLCTKNKRIAVKSGNIKYCQVRRVANNSTHSSTSNYYSRHKRATKTAHHSSNQRGWPPDCYETHLQLLAPFNLPFLSNSWWATNERASERANSLLYTTWKLLLIATQTNVTSKIQLWNVRSVTKPQSQKKNNNRN